MKPAPFEYHAPTTVDEALATLADLGDDAKVLAGGQSLVPMLNLRLARFDHLVDIGRVDELRGIERRQRRRSSSAPATRDPVIEFDPTVAAAVPLLAAVTPYIGHFQIRNRGTIGGSMVHADPAAEYPAVALALDATFDVVVGRGQPSVPAADFFTGVWSTALGAGELLRSIAFPVWSGRCGFGVAEFARRHGDFAIAGAVAAVELGRRRRRRAQRARRVRRGGHPVAGHRRPRPRSPGERSAEVDPAEVGPMVFDAIDDVTDDPQVPAGLPPPGRRGDGRRRLATSRRRAVGRERTR